MSSTDTFYQKLQPLKRFSELTEDTHYTELPDDWTVVITDVRGATKAIEEGRYKDVNLVGAATIAAARNVLGNLNFPFVFGGDGASFAVPNNQMAKITEAMSGLRTMSVKNFDLELRIGAVEMKSLHEANAHVEVAKYDLIADRCITLFRGGGLTLAERWIKEEDSDYLLPLQADAQVSMKGLSCRWNAIPSQRGEVLSILAQARTERSYDIYAKLITKIDVALDGQLEAANPVNTHLSTYQSIRQCFRQERRLHQSPWSVRYWLRLAEIMFCVVVFKFGVRPLIFRPERYAESMRVHTDYRKFDDMLRMVIDVSAEQSASIESLLAEKYQAGLIYYGLHRSESSLMTCFVDDITDGQHIHFVDGSSGGYAVAAKQLKAQMKGQED